MAKLAAGRQIGCPHCSADCGNIENLGVHLLDEHAAVASTAAVDARMGLQTTGRELLSKDAELALGNLIRKNGPRAAEARNFLVECNLRLVVAFVMRGRHHPSRVPDLIQEGNIGLMRAAELFDPSQGCRFSTYAVWWIKQTIQRGKSKHDMVQTPDGSKWKLSKARRLLADGRLPEKVAAELGLSIGSLRAALNATAFKTISLDQGTAGDEGHSLGRILAAADAPSRSFAGDELDSILAGLKEKQRIVLARRFGLDGKPEQTLDEVGQDLGLSRERVRQIEQQAISILKRRHDRSGTLLSKGAFVDRRWHKTDGVLNQHQQVASVVDRRDEAIEEEAVGMAKEVVTRGEDLACGKCEKPFRFEAWRDRHAKKCKGRKAPPAPRAANLESDGSVEEEPDLPMQRPAARKDSSLPTPQNVADPVPLVVVDQVGPQLSAKTRILNMLEVEEEQLVKQLGDVKRLIVVVLGCEDRGSE